MSGKCCGIGTYRCQELAFICECCGHAVWVDKCLKDEVAGLHGAGVATVGCCCGHGAARGYIQVMPEHVGGMLELGYTPISAEVVDGCELGPWCFEPKSEVSA